MLSLKAQIEKLPPAERPHVIRLTRSVLNETLLAELTGHDATTNPIRASVLSSALAKAIESLNAFPEADDAMPMQREVRYEFSTE